MFAIRNERSTDIDARDALLDSALGPQWRAKASERVREGRLPTDGLSLVATEKKRVVGTVRLWHVSAGPGRPALLLGPLAVAADRRNRGIGTALMQQALLAAARLGHGAVLLVGDSPYYGRFGFSTEKTGALRLPGPFEQHRLLACELLSGALDGACGLIRATGHLQVQPDPALVAASGKRRARPAARAA